MGIHLGWPCAKIRDARRRASPHMGQFLQDGENAR